MSSRRGSRRGENEESNTIRRMENQHCTESRRNLYVALEKLDFIWDEKQVVEVDSMWDLGIPIDVMADSFERTINDVFALLWDRLEKGNIQPRKGHVWGRSG